MKKLGHAALILLAIMLVGGVLILRSPQNNPTPNPAERRAGDGGTTPSSAGIPITQEAGQVLVSLPVSDLQPPEGSRLPDLDRTLNPREPNPDQINAILTHTNITTETDPLAASGLNTDRAAPGPTVSFSGLNNNTADHFGLRAGWPPDTFGDVGENYYIQYVNLGFQIYDKIGAPQNSHVTHLSWLYQSAGSSGRCAQSDDGDPIVLYDQFHKRWFLAQFYIDTSPYALCVAVSATEDPLGSFLLFEFDMGSDFPDYPKWGIFPDALLLGLNQSSGSNMYVYDWQAMVNGQWPTAFFLGSAPNFPMPADVEGPLLPDAEMDGLFYTVLDNVFHGGVDRLRLYTLKNLQWENGTYTFTHTDIPLSSFTYTVCGFFNLSCIPQQGTTHKLDAVSEWPMTRLVYRNFADFETLVASFTVDVGGDRAGTRWFELRRTSSAWTKHQEGTFAPGSDHYFMSSITQDDSKNLALGFSVSSCSMYPAVRYTVHEAGDPLGTMQTEAVLFNGTGYQQVITTQGRVNRWGDYTAMSLDPDGCTFWYTGQFYLDGDNQDWQTVIGAFSLPNCDAMELQKIFLPLNFK
jgi:hypothetical protein